MPGPTRTRRICWTLNNPTEDQIKRLESLDLVAHRLTYLVFGQEIAPTTQTPHLQGYTEAQTACGFNKWKSILGSMEVHLECLKGTPQQASEYCKKDGKFTEIGQLSQPGKRTDILRIQEMIDTGMTDREIAIRYFSAWSRMRGAITAYRNLISPPSTSPQFPLESFPSTWPRVLATNVTILWGETDIGKTSYAKALLPGALMVSHCDDLRHFKEEEHNGIIFDDMDFTHFPRSAQIHIVDTADDRSIHCRYDVAFIPAGTKKIFTTNNFNGSIFMDDPAIARRIETIHLVK